MNAKLVVASGKSAGRAISLKNGRILIGRAEECDIRPLGEEVSRRHCLILVEGDAVTVEDLKSRNGTFVNGERIPAKMTVKGGDIVRVGPLELKVSLPAAVPADPAVPTAPAAMDDVSRWLMADDEPAGMFDTTQTVRVPDPPAAAEAAPRQADDSSVARAKAAEQQAGGAAPAPEGGAAAPGGSAIEALLATRAHPGVLPEAARNASKSNNSKDAAADALRKFFGKR
jgi:hypothetical protein